jgi:3-deoxy-D-manno-octulosonic-acid transferase
LKANPDICLQFNKTVHLFFYNIFLLVYNVAIRIASIWNSKARRWIEGRKGIWEQLMSGVETRDSQLVWMHCASLGEFEQGRPLLEGIRSQYPTVKILITFFSPSGYEIRKNYPGADWVSYLPMDSKLSAEKFISIVQPTLVLWVKYEYWYYFIAALKKKGIPTLLVSGIFRDDQPFFKWYGRLHRYMLECFTHLFIQNEASKKLLGKLGISSNVTISGDTRFDRVAAIAGQEEPIPIIEEFCGNSKVIVAGSTWEEDEEEMDHYANTHTEIKFIVAPHEIDEEHLKEMEKLFKNTVRYSKLNGILAKEEESRSVEIGNIKNVLIIDNVGMLARLYKYATITYVGGGFGDDGVHNVLEAAVYGKPVVIGPVYEKYPEAEELVDVGGGISVETALELEKALNDLFEDKDQYKQASEASYQYVHSRKGATGKILEYIQEKRLLTN